MIMRYLTKRMPVCPQRPERFREQLVLFRVSLVHFQVSLVHFREWQYTGSVS